MLELDLAKYVVSKCIDDGHPISNFQLQRILFWIQYEVVKRTGWLLFYELMRVTDCGIRMDNSYYYYCIYGEAKIKDKTPEYTNLIKDEKRKAIIDKIVVEKQKQDAWESIVDNHENNRVWVRARNNGDKVIGLNHILYDINNNRYLKLHKKQSKITGCFEDLINGDVERLEEFLDAKCRIYRKESEHKWIELEVAKYKNNSILSYNILLTITITTKGFFGVCGKTVWGDVWKFEEFTDEDSMFNYIKMCLNNEINK